MTEERLDPKQLHHESIVKLDAKNLHLALKRRGGKTDNGPTTVIEQNLKQSIRRAEHHVSKRSIRHILKVNGLSSLIPEDPKEI